MELSLGKDDKRESITGRKEHVLLFVTVGIRDADSNPGNPGFLCQ
jgi:hypothetical protein